MQEAWKLAIRYAQTSKGGSANEAKHVNLAREVLKDNERRLDYNNALIKYNLPDGQTKRPNFKDYLESRVPDNRNSTPSEV